MVKRFKVSARRGVTLVELMIAMLILAIVCVAWLEIIGIQSARKEARRREAVERLAGMMDAFMYDKRQVSSVQTGYYEMNCTNYIVNISYLKNSDEVRKKAFPIFDTFISPIGYQLCVERKSNTDMQFRDWIGYSGISVKTGDITLKTSSLWLRGMLYDRNGMLEERDRPFCTLSVCLGL